MALRDLPNLTNVSGLIITAVEDLIAVERSKRYVVDMGVWHDPIDNNQCEVCLAGSVIAKTIGEDPEKHAEPEDYSFKVQRQLEALDEFRVGDIVDGWYILFQGNRRFPLGDDMEYCQMPDYKQDRGAFKRKMRWLARQFEAAGY